jgi:SAM-dependent methyltransferase
LTEDFYNKLHESYFPISPQRRGNAGYERTTRCRSIIDQCKPRDILEIGFENPHLSKSIAEIPGVNYVGIDISDVSVKAAQEIGLKALVLDVSAKELPFDDQSFDLIYCAEVIEHLINPDFAVEEFRRVLRPEGRILITTPNLASWYNRIILLFGIQPVHTEVSTLRVLGRKFSTLGQGNRPVGHLRLFTLGGLVDFLQLHRLTIVSIEGYRLELLGKVAPLEKVMSKFTPLASGFIALVQKKKEACQ